MDAFEVIILLLILGGIAYGVIHLFKVTIPRFLDNSKASLLGQHGHCTDCKYCVRDSAHKFSDTDYFCRLSRCSNITESTTMDCMIKPTVTEQDLDELFAFNIWNADGKEYIRNSILGKTMTFSEVDAFLKKIPVDHPEYINTDAARNYANN